MRETRVDLPEPVGPTMARDEPAGMLRLMSWRTVGAVGVGEGEVAEFDIAGDGAGRELGGSGVDVGSAAVGATSNERGVVGDGGLLLEEFVDADDGGGSALEEVDDPADGDDGPDELHHVDVEAGELADGDAGGGRPRGLRRGG